MKRAWTERNQREEETARGGNGQPDSDSAINYKAAVSGFDLLEV